MDDKHAIKKTINQTMRERGRFPTLQEMCDKLNFSAEQTGKYMEALKEDGYLEAIGDWYRFPIKDEKQIRSIFIPDKEPSYVDLKEDVIIDEPKELEHSVTDEPSIPVGIIEEKDVAIVMDHASNKHTTTYTAIERKRKDIKDVKKWFQKLKFEKKPNKKKKLAKANSKIYGMPVYIVQFMMGVIGSGAAVISVYYTTVWLFEFLPWAFALLLSTIMVGFAIAAFETIILLMSGQVTESRIAKIVMSVGFLILFIIVSLFSIMSTVAGQYNKYVANLRIETKKGDSSSNANYILLKEEKSDLRTRLTGYRKQANNFSQILSGMTKVKDLEEKSSIWKNTQYRLYLANKNIKHIGNRLNQIRREEKILIKKGQESGSILVGVSTEKTIPNFYGWLSSIFKIGTDKIQFIMSLFPAIFVDVISPVGIGLALFLRNKYK